MFAALLARVGLSFLAPFIVPALISAVISGLGGVAWWNNWLDIPQALILTAGAMLIYLYSVASSEIVRLAILFALVGLGYVNGRLDESQQTQTLLDANTKAIHEQYKMATAKEKARQEQVAQAAKADADKLKAKRLVEVLALRSKLQALRKEAIDAPTANDPAFDLDAIDRLNRLRR